MSFSLSDLKNAFNGPPKSTPTSAAPTTSAPNVSDLLVAMENIYGSEPQNWYTAKPYGFKMTLRNGNQFVFFLPINPQNINITTQFATNVISTLYGTVEEHSDVRYFDIVIEGTTGMAPKYTKPGAISSNGDISAASATLARSGRSRVSIAQGVSLGGFFSKTLSLVNQTLNKASDLINGAPQTQAAFTVDNSGYAAFHNLYRFLLRHKKDASGTDGGVGQRKGHPLTFFNYKDNNMYDVAVRNFTLKRSVEDPMLYYYSIQLRGYNLRSISLNSTQNADLSQRLADLGLNGVNGSSVLGEIKSISSQAKGIIGSAIGGINVFGQ